MKKVLNSPIKIGHVTVRIVPNLQSEYGLSHQICLDYAGCFAVTVSSYYWQKPTEEKYDKVLRKAFGGDVTLNKIKINSYVFYMEKDMRYFVAILKVKTLQELEK